MAINFTIYSLIQAFALTEINKSLSEEKNEYLIYLGHHMYSFIIVNLCGCIIISDIGDFSRVFYRFYKNIFKDLFICWQLLKKMIKFLHFNCAISSFIVNTAKRIFFSNIILSISQKIFEYSVRCTNCVMRSLFPMLSRKGDGEGGGGG